MPRTEIGNAINDLGKECRVLLHKLSNSDISSLQENPMQIKKCLDLPYRRSGKYCSVLLRRLTESEIRNAMKSTRITTASYLPKKTPYVLIKKLQKLSIQAERKKRHQASQFRIHFGYPVYLELFEKYLIDLKNNETEMTRKLAKKNINSQLLVEHPGGKRVNENLVVWIIKRFRGQRKGFGKIQIDRENIARAARAVLGEVEIGYETHIVPRNLTSDIRTNPEISTENRNLLSVNVSRHDVGFSSIGGAPENPCAEQTSLESEDISSDKYKEKEMTIRSIDYLFPIDAPEIPEDAIILMSDCLGYLNKLKETNVNRNRMRLESAHLTEQTDINASQNKMRNKAKDLRKIQKKNIIQRCTSREEKMLVEIMYGIKFPRGF